MDTINGIASKEQEVPQKICDSVSAYESTSSQSTSNTSSSASSKSQEECSVSETPVVLPKKKEVAKTVHPKCKTLPQSKSTRKVMETVKQNGNPKIGVKTNRATKGSGKNIINKKRPPSVTEGKEKTSYQFLRPLPPPLEKSVKVSTPTKDVVPEFCNDLSAIDSSSLDFSTVSKVKAPEKLLGSPRVQKSKQKGDSQTTEEGTPKKNRLLLKTMNVKDPSEVSEEDAAYTHYLQPVYLFRLISEYKEICEGKAVKSMYSKHQEAKSSLEELAAIQKRLDEVRYLKSLEKSLDNQTKCLKEIEKENLEKCGTLLGSLCLELGKIRNQLPVTGLKVPQETESMNELKGLFKDASSIANEIQEMMGSEVKPLESSQAFRKNFKEEIDQQKQILLALQHQLPVLNSQVMRECSLILSQHPVFTDSIEDSE